MTPTSAEIYRLSTSYIQPSLLAWRALELPAYDRQGSSLVLDLGAGLGYFTAEIAPNAIAVDFDLRQLQESRASGRVTRAVQADITALPFRTSGATAIVANCVFEHIRDLDDALGEMARVLDDDGTLQTTVPVEELNDAYVFRSPRYRRLRNRQLLHLNLHTLDGWVQRFAESGFSHADSEPVVFKGQARRWDLLDAPLFIGLGRYTWFNAYCRVLALFPALGRYHRPLSKRLATWITKGRRPHDPAVCVFFRIGK